VVECEVGNCGAKEPVFGDRGRQRAASEGVGVEEVSRDDGGADAASGGERSGFIHAAGVERGAVTDGICVSSARRSGVGRLWGREMTRDHLHVSHLGKGREALTTEAEGGDRAQIFGGVELGRRVAGANEGKVIVVDAMAVIGNTERDEAAALGDDGDVGGTGVERVLQQLLES
jgi:hypothetical protein